MLPLEDSPAHTYLHIHTYHTRPANHRQSSPRRVNPPTSSSFLVPAPTVLPPSLPPAFSLQHETSRPGQEAAPSSLRRSFPASFLCPLIFCACVHEQ